MNHCFTTVGWKELVDKLPENQRTDHVKGVWYQLGFRLLRSYPEQSVDHAFKLWRRLFPWRGHFLMSRCSEDPLTQKPLNGGYVPLTWDNCYSSRRRKKWGSESRKSNTGERGGNTPERETLGHGLAASRPGECSDSRHTCQGQTLSRALSSCTIFTSFEQASWERVFAGVFWHDHATLLSSLFLLSGAAKDAGVAHVLSAYAWRGRWTLGAWE